MLFESAWGGASSSTGWCTAEGTSSKQETFFKQLGEGPRPADGGAQQRGASSTKDAFLINLGRGLVWQRVVHGSAAHSRGARIVPKMLFGIAWGGASSSIGWCTAEGRV